MITAPRMTCDASEEPAAVSGRPSAERRPRAALLRSMGWNRAGRQARSTIPAGDEAMAWRLAKLAFYNGLRCGKGLTAQQAARVVGEQCLTLERWARAAQQDYSELLRGWGAGHWFPSAEVKQDNAFGVTLSGRAAAQYRLERMRLHRNLRRRGVSCARAARIVRFSLTALMKWEQWCSDARSSRRLEWPLRLPGRFQRRLPPALAPWEVQKLIGRCPIPAGKMQNGAPRQMFLRDGLWGAGYLLWLPVSFLP